MALMSGVAGAKDLISLPILTHYAGRELYGAWTQAVSLTAFAGPLVSLGLLDGFVRFSSGLPTRTQAAYMSALLGVTATLGAAVLAAIWLVRDAVSALLYGPGESHTTILLAGATFVLVTPILSAFENWFLIRGDRGVLVDIGDSCLGVVHYEEDLRLSPSEGANSSSSGRSDPAVDLASQANEGTVQTAGSLPKDTHFEAWPWGLRFAPMPTSSSRTRAWQEGSVAPLLTPEGRRFP